MGEALRAQQELNTYSLGEVKAYVDLADKLWWDYKDTRALPLTNNVAVRAEKQYKSQYAQQKFWERNIFQPTPEFDNYWQQIVQPSLIVLRDEQSIDPKNILLSCALQRELPHSLEANIGVGIYTGLKITQKLSGSSEGEVQDGLDLLNELMGYFCRYDNFIAQNSDYNLILASMLVKKGVVWDNDDRIDKLLKEWTKRIDSKTQALSLLPHMSFLIALYLVILNEKFGRKAIDSLGSLYDFKLKPPRRTTPYFIEQVAAHWGGVWQYAILNPIQKTA